METISDYVNYSPTRPWQASNVQNPPETRPTTGPVRAIITLGESGSGIDLIIAASRGWLAMYLLKNSMCEAMIHTEFARPGNGPWEKGFSVGLEMK